MDLFVFITRICDQKHFHISNVSILHFAGDGGFLQKDRLSKDKCKQWINITKWSKFTTQVTKLSCKSISGALESSMKVALFSNKLSVPCWLLDNLGAWPPLPTCLWRKYTNTLALDNNKKTFSKIKETQRRSIWSKSLLRDPSLFKEDLLGNVQYIPWILMDENICGGTCISGLGLGDDIFK